MREQIQALLVQLYRLSYTYQTKIADMVANAGSSPITEAMRDEAMQAMVLAEAAGLLATQWQFSTEERAAALQAGGWPADEVAAMMELAKAKEKLASFGAAKKAKTTLN